MKTELNPCLCCGDKNSHAVYSGRTYVENGIKNVYGVRCDNCGFTILSFISEKDAIEAWNRSME